MQGPDAAFRRRLVERMDEVESEDELEGVLDEIDEALVADLALEEVYEQDPEEVLAAAEAWAGVASYAVARFYGPASPWPRNVGGWGRKAVGRLRRISARLVPPLQQVQQALGSASFSIGVSFPWGLSIGLSW